ASPSRERATTAGNVSHDRALGEPVLPCAESSPRRAPRPDRSLHMSELTLAMAERAVGAAQARARELGTPITVTVVDDDGRLILCARGDGTGFLTPETSRGKAVASAAFRRSTKELVDLAREHPAFWNAIPG